MANRRDVAIRLSGEGVRATEQQLTQFGERGKRALDRIATASTPASRGLVTVDRATRELRARAEGLAGGLGGVGTVMRGLGPAGLAGAAGIGALVVGLRGAMQLADQAIANLSSIGATADRLGLTAEQLQELRFAAEQNNVATATLDLSWQRFTRRLGEAQNGTGELLGVLQQYNIELKNADGSNRSAIQVYRDFADAVKGVKDPQEQLRLAFKAFDSEGAALVRVLRQGSDGLDIYVARVRETGIVIENEIVQRATDAGDRMNELQLRQQAALNTIGEYFTFASEQWQTAKTEILQAVADIVSGLDGVGSSVNSFMNRLGGGAVDLTDEEIANLPSAIRDKILAARAASSATVPTFSVVNTAGAGGLPIPRPRGTEPAGRNSAASATRAATAAEIERQRIVRQGLALQQQVETAQERYYRQVEEAQRLLAEGAIDEETYRRAQLQAFDALARAQDGFARSGVEAAGELEQAWGQATRAMGQEFASFLTTGEFNFNRFLNSIISQLVNSQINSIFGGGGSGGFLSGIGSSLFSLVGGFFGGGASQSPLSAGDQLLTSNAIGFAFADGGRVPGPAGMPVPATVHAGEIVLNAAQQRNVAGAIGGGGEMRVVVVNETGVPARAEGRAERGPDGMQQIRLFIRAEVRDALGDGSLDPLLNSQFGLQRQGV